METNITSTTQPVDQRAELMASLESGDSALVHALVQELHPADVADVLESIPPALRPIIWREISHELVGEVLLELPEAVRVGLIEEMDDEILFIAVQALDTDDVADLVPHLSDELVSRLLFALDKREREQLDRVLAFPEDTAGGLMNVDTVTIRDDISIGVVLRYLRRLGRLPEYTNKLFVLDRTGRMAGRLLLSELLTNAPEAMVRDVMQPEEVWFPALTSDREVAAAFERYNLITAPVVDDDQRLIGRITIDDVVDVIREEADHSVMAPAGLSEDEDIFAPVVRSAKNRAVWLGVNLITAVFASWVIGLFESTIQKVVALAVLMPIVASMGGNAGTQTVTLVVRGLALGTVTAANARQVLRTEISISLLNSVAWALVTGAIALIWYGNAMLGLVIGLAMTINLVMAALAGVLIPLVVKRMGIDPALASGVVLTTVTDVVGFFVFLSLAGLLLF